MRVVVTTEFRFDRSPDGKIWTATVFPHSFWTRYLEAFDQVGIMARVQDIDEPSAGHQRVDGNGVQVIALPHYLGPAGLLRKYRQIHADIAGAITDSDAILYRAPSQIAGIAKSASSSDRPYGVEVVGDPYDVFAPGASAHPLRPLFRWWFTNQLRQLCSGATVASYVTQGALQARYPPHDGAFVTHYSSIELHDEAFVRRPKRFDSDKASYTVVTVGTLAQLYKGTDTLIDAVGRLVREGLDVRLVVVGDGQYREALQRRASVIGIGERTEFLGQLPGGASVRAQLDRADLFVLPSRQEGLPRAMIEAMARAVPCIGSRVGGIPELLPANCLVESEQPEMLARAINSLLADPAQMTELSARNLTKSREFHDTILRQRRNSLYTALREATLSWTKTE